VNPPANVTDFQEKIEELVESAKKDFERRAEAVLKMAYIPLDALPARAFADVVVESADVYVILGWTTRLQEGFKLYDTTLAITYETPLAWKLEIIRTEVDVYYIGKDKYETIYGTERLIIWLPKSQVQIGKAFGFPVIRMPSWLAKKYPLLLRLSARMLRELADVDA
jgi:hypothetical protein